MSRPNGNARTDTVAGGNVASVNGCGAAATSTSGPATAGRGQQCGDRILRDTVRGQSGLGFLVASLNASACSTGCPG